MKINKIERFFNANKSVLSLPVNNINITDLANAENSLYRKKIKIQKNCTKDFTIEYLYKSISKI